MIIKSCGKCKHSEKMKEKVLWWEEEWLVCKGPHCKDIITGGQVARMCDYERYGYPKYADSSKHYQDVMDYQRKTACGAEGIYWVGVE